MGKCWASTGCGLIDKNCKTAACGLVLLADGWGHDALDLEIPQAKMWDFCPGSDVQVA